MPPSGPAASDAKREALPLPADAGAQRRRPAALGAAAAGRLADGVAAAAVPDAHGAQRALRRLGARIKVAAAAPAVEADAGAADLEPADTGAVGRPARAREVAAGIAPPARAHAVGAVVVGPAAVATCPAVLHVALQVAARPVAHLHPTPHAPRWPRRAAYPRRASRRRRRRRRRRRVSVRRRRPAAARRAVDPRRASRRRRRPCTARIRRQCNHAGRSGGIECHGHVVGPSRPAARRPCLRRIDGSGRRARSHGRIRDCCRRRAGQNLHPPYVSSPCSEAVPRTYHAGPCHQARRNIQA
ncbi:hypothetical protein BS50DRAFT_593396 [Corynespora cassiicola Philippines]|uniref:Uncharacterized protein n=1 Tax=Corynespora cassiicola Philippines TaxID=1448308 RepID=A0A2T2N6K6_CORCC|nr:hypothetical protein BS50DRAFT_593396 [Corynespora cassiicola Philippines]